MSVCPSCSIHKITKHILIIFGTGNYTKTCGANFIFTILVKYHFKSHDIFSTLRETQNESTKNFSL